MRLHQERTSTWLMGAFAASSTFTTAACPFMAAMCSGVVPSVCAAHGSMEITHSRRVSGGRNTTSPRHGDPRPRPSAKARAGSAALHGRHDCHHRGSGQPLCKQRRWLTAAARPPPVLHTKTHPTQGSISNTICAVQYPQATTMTPLPASNSNHPIKAGLAVLSHPCDGHGCVRPQKGLDSTHIAALGRNVQGGGPISLQHHMEGGGGGKNERAA